ncbi:MAG: hypothetical protein ACRD3J_07860, partial [Thermoanaerobaculia bacterium]
MARGLRQDRGDRKTDVSHAADYYQALRGSERLDGLDDATWGDLNMHDVFMSLDRTRSQPGGQFLYKTVRMPVDSRQALEHLEEAVRRFARDDAVTRQVREALHPLSDPRAVHLVSLLFRALPRRPKLWWTFPILTSASFLCLGVVYFWPRAAVVWLAICVVNICVQLFYKERVRPFIAAYHEIPSLLNVARAIGKQDVREISTETNSLAKNERDLRLLRRATSWLVFESGQVNEIVSTVYEYLNLLFLLDINAFVFGTQAIERSRGQLREMFDAIGYIDTAQSIATWRDSLSWWANPLLTGSGKKVKATDLFHPLLARPVSNSIDINDSSVLIT